MWSHLQRNLGNPALADLKRWFDRHVPTEARR
jgi:aminoglycoside/choline kinase family phosphotransferase